MTRSYRNSTGGKRRRRKRRVKQRHRDAKRFRVRRGSEPMEFWRAHRGCVDKTRFYSAKLARKAAEELGLKPYRCTFCGHWHLTSKGLTTRKGGDMIKRAERSDVPPIRQPKRKRRPEGAFAQRQMAEFLASGLDLAEVTDIPAAYNTTALYGSLSHAAWALCDRPRSVRVIRRGGRLFLAKEEVARELYRDYGASRAHPVA